MKWFRKQTAPAGASVQLRETGYHPFGLLGQYVPMRSGEIRLYRAVREAVPVVDAAIYKLIRMAGGVTAACSDKTAERALEEFLRTVFIVLSGKAKRILSFYCIFARPKK